MEPAYDRLRAARLRVAHPRLAVLPKVAPHTHASAETITAGARGRLELSKQAAYDVVHALSGAGPSPRTSRPGPRRGEASSHDVGYLAAQPK